jgi:predicted short-subunit dehydrogenase-like oxidoreductase (DUF2520 family)
MMKNSKELTLGFIGAGTTGTALAVSLSRRGYRVVGVSSRSISSSERLAGMVDSCRVYERAQKVADVAQLVFVTTPDDVISQVADEVQWHSGQYVVHCSGAHSTDILDAARRSGASTGSFHPLQTFAGIEQAIKNLPGSMFGIEAEEPLQSVLREMAETLEGEWVILKAQDKVLYHAAAVFACNYLVTLVKLATDLWQTFGVSQTQATRALLPLLRGTLNNIENIGLPNCLTGPIARGDLGTIKRHLEALEKQAPSVLSTYRELGWQTVPIALAKGRVDSQRAKEMKTLLGKTED